MVVTGDKGTRFANLEKVRFQKRYSQNHVFTVFWTFDLKCKAGKCVCVLVALHFSETLYPI